MHVSVAERVPTWHTVDPQPSMASVFHFAKCFAPIVLPRIMQSLAAIMAARATVMTTFRSQMERALGTRTTKTGRRPWTSGALRARPRRRCPTRQTCLTRSRQSVFTHSQRPTPVRTWLTLPLGPRWGRRAARHGQISATPTRVLHLRQKNWLLTRARHTRLMSFSRSRQTFSASGSRPATK